MKGHLHVSGASAAKGFQQRNGFCLENETRPLAEVTQQNRQKWALHGMVRCVCFVGRSCCGLGWEWCVLETNLRLCMHVFVNVETKHRFMQSQAQLQRLDLDCTATIILEPKARADIGMPKS